MFYRNCFADSVISVTFSTKTLLILQDIVCTLCCLCAQCGIKEYGSVLFVSLTLFLVTLCFFFRYNLMLCCWEENPSKRPAFSQIVNRLEILMQDLSDQVRQEVKHFYAKNRFFSVCLFNLHSFKSPCVVCPFSK